MSDCLLCLIVILMTIQCRKSQLTLCEEYVASLTVVDSCPQSKEEWDIAASKKNCSQRAAGLTCAASEEFKYHCVINGYRNALVEVCAPKRLILGHCTEFNNIGRVIQDHRTAPCQKGSFPNCDKFYFSTDAYKYPDCYDLVHPQGTPRKKPTVYNYIWLIIVAAVVAVVILISIILVLVYLKRNQPNVQMRNRNGYTYSSQQRGSGEVAFTRTSGSSVTQDQRHSSSSTHSADFQGDNETSYSAKCDELRLAVP